MPTDTPKSNTWQYLIALLVLALLEIIFVLGINFLRPDKDNVPIMIMVGTILVPMVTSFLNIINGEKAKTATEEVKRDLTHTKSMVNGRVEELIKAATVAAYAEGYQAGKSEAILMLATPPPADKTAIPASEPDQS